MKLEESKWRAVANDTDSHSFSIAVLKLGRAGGKMKYTVLDGRDVSLTHGRSLEASMEVNSDGDGAVIFALIDKQPLHKAIWERHRGEVDGHLVVVHRNGVSVDNRLDNLRLIRKEHFLLWMQTTLHTNQTRDDHLYWLAISQIPSEDSLRLPSSSSSSSSSSSKSSKSSSLLASSSECFHWADHADWDEIDDTLLYYECHYAPCTRIEAEVKQFSICGRCQEARYCGTACQQRDWAGHKRECRERFRRFALVDWPIVEANPER